MLIKLRRSVVIFLIIQTLIIIFLVRSVFTLLTLLTETGDADAITHGEIPAPNSTAIEKRPQLIPKIIHQTYINATIPERWREPVQQCLDIHKDYEYKV
jgi:mannosyltransferase OCH1-like enzyme